MNAAHCGPQGTAERDTYEGKVLRSFFLLKDFGHVNSFQEKKKKKPTNLWHFPWQVLLMNVLSIFAVWWPSGVFGGGYATYKPGNLYFHCQVLIMMST